jgi:hypothetical protein
MVDGDGGPTLAKVPKAVSLLKMYSLAEFKVFIAYF